MEKRVLLQGKRRGFKSSVLSSDIKILEKSKGINVIKRSSLNIRFIQMNCMVKSFDDFNVRRALAHSFDKQNLIDAIIYGDGVIANYIIPLSLGWPNHPDLKRQIFSPCR